MRFRRSTLCFKCYVMKTGAERVGKSRSVLNSVGQSIPSARHPKGAKCARRLPRRCKPTRPSAAEQYAGGEPPVQSFGRAKGCAMEANGQRNLLKLDDVLAPIATAVPVRPESCKLKDTQSA